MKGHRTFCVGPFMVSTTRQAGGAPWFDRCGSAEVPGRMNRRWRSVAIKPSLRRLPNRRSGWALVVGWREPTRTRSYER